MAPSDEAELNRSLRSRSRSTPPAPSATRATTCRLQLRRRRSTNRSAQPRRRNGRSARAARSAKAPTRRSSPTAPWRRTRWLAAEELAAEGIYVGVIDARFCKPRRRRDARPRAPARATRCSRSKITPCKTASARAVLEYAVAHGLPTDHLTRLGMPDRLIAHATRKEQLAEVGLDPAGIARKRARCGSRSGMRWCVKLVWLIYGECPPHPRRGKPGRVTPHELTAEFKLATRTSCVFSSRCRIASPLRKFLVDYLTTVHCQLCAISDELLTACSRSNSAAGFGSRGGELEYCARAESSEFWSMWDFIDQRLGQQSLSMMASRRRFEIIRSSLRSMRRRRAAADVWKNGTASPGGTSLPPTRLPYVVGMIERWAAQRVARFLGAYHRAMAWLWKADRSAACCRH